MSRASQPYRKGSQWRMPGPALNAMLRGSTAAGFNPIDARRAAYLMPKSHGSHGRPPRPPRTARAPRTPR